MSAIGSKARANWRPNSNPGSRPKTKPTSPATLAAPNHLATKERGSTSFMRTSFNRCAASACTNSRKAGESCRLSSAVSASSTAATNWWRNPGHACSSMAA